MRNSDDRLRAILIKAGDKDKREQKKRRARVLREAGLSALCLCLIVAASFLLPRPEAERGNAAGGQFGSLLLSSPYIGYIVIGTLSFAPGISLTLLCLFLRRREKPEEQHGDD